MSRRRALLMQKRSLEINTIIGGMASVITTREQLATRLAVSQRRIRNFTIVGNDIHCAMMQLYHIPYFAFQNDTNITDYIDLDNKVRAVGNGAFLGSTLINFYAPNAIVNAQGLYRSFTNEDFDYEYLNLREDPFSGIDCLRQSRFKKLNAPNAIALSSNAVRDNTQLLEVYAPNLEVISTYAFNGCILLNTMTTENIESVGARAFFNTGFTSLDLPKLTSVSGIAPFWYMTKLVTFSAPIVEEIPSTSCPNFFGDWRLIEEIDMRMLKVFGSPSSEYTNAFGSAKSGFTWKVNIAMATNNSGGADASLLYAKNSKSAIVEFYDDFGNYVSTL